MKVGGKMFALIPLESENTSISLKCDPEKALALREQFSNIFPGYHLSKKHWNTIIIDESITQKMIRDMIMDSYYLVIAGLPKKAREQF